MTLVQPSRSVACWGRKRRRRLARLVLFSGGAASVLGSLSSPQNSRDLDSDDSRDSSCGRPYYMDGGTWKALGINALQEALRRAMSRASSATSIEEEAVVSELTDLPRYDVNSRGSRQSGRLSPTRVSDASLSKSAINESAAGSVCRLRATKRAYPSSGSSTPCLYSTSHNSLSPSAATQSLSEAVRSKPSTDGVVPPAVRLLSSGEASSTHRSSQSPKGFSEVQTGSSRPEVTVGSFGNTENSAIEAGFSLLEKSAFSCRSEGTTSYQVISRRDRTDRGEVSSKDNLPSYKREILDFVLSFCDAYDLEMRAAVPTGHKSQWSREELKNLNLRKHTEDPIWRVQRIFDKRYKSDERVVYAQERRAEQKLVTSLHEVAREAKFLLSKIDEYFDNSARECEGAIAKQMRRYDHLQQLLVRASYELLMLQRPELRRAEITSATISRLPTPTPLRIRLRVQLIGEYLLGNSTYKQHFLERFQNMLLDLKLWMKAHPPSRNKDLYTILNRLESLQLRWYPSQWVLLPPADCGEAAWEELHQKYPLVP